MDPTLGFAQLLGIAQGNQGNQSNKNNLLKTKFSGNKKAEKREKGKLSVNVQKFLEKKEAEEKKKKIEAKLQREKLNQLRSDRDKNKIAKHLKVTKSANYSVLSDAVDNKNTSITLTGRAQCDEDDYGFASTTSQGIYEKLMNKYEADPEDPMAKFSKAKPKELKDLRSAKERVKEALKREEANPMIPGKRRSKLNESEKIQPGCVRGGVSGVGKSRFEDSADRAEREKEREKEREYERKKDEERRAKSEKERKEEEARKKRIQNAKKAPPPVDFQSLLKMASQKKDIPVKIEKKKVADSEFGARPMTEQEKKEFMRENESRLRREGKLQAKDKVSVKKKERSPVEELDMRDSRKVMKPPEPGPMFHPSVKKQKREESRGSSHSNDTSRSSSHSSDFEKEKREMERKMKELQEKKAELESKQKVMQFNEKKRQDFQRRQDEEKRKEIERKREQRKVDEEKKEFEDMQSKYKEMQRKMKDMEARLKGGDGGKDGGKLSSSSSKRDPHKVEARHFPGEKRKDQDRRDYYKSSSSNKRRIESDSEDEYDSEMDDFLDDSEAKVDISKEIRSIFGYDKRRYRDEDDEDDRGMENNRFSSIMMEEARSARIGRQEDLEDMRREEEELRRKKKRR